MTVPSPPEQENPSASSSSWQVAVVALIDRSLDSRHRFRRLALLLMLLLPLLAAATLLAASGLHGALGLFRM